MLVDRGLLDYDEPVATYWPEFAQQGKDRITLRQLLNHQAGLSAIEETMTLAALADWEQLAGFLARQRPLWEPGRVPHEVGRLRPAEGIAPSGERRIAPTI